MNLHYKIIEIYPDDNLVVVRYWTDMLSQQDLASDSRLNEHDEPVRCRSDVSVTLPIPTPADQELDDLLVRSAPFEWLKMMEKVKDPEVDTSLEGIYQLHHKVFSKKVEEMTAAGVNALSDSDIEKLIESITSGNTTPNSNTASI